MNDLQFLASDSLVKELEKNLEKVAKTVIEWGTQNAIIYDISIMEIILFSKACWQSFNK